jgi:hypothetical protein
MVFLLNIYYLYYQLLIIFFLERHKEKKERKNFQFSFVDFDKYKEKCAVNCAEEEAAGVIINAAEYYLLSYWLLSLSII